MSEGSPSTTTTRYIICTYYSRLSFDDSGKFYTCTYNRVRFIDGSESRFHYVEVSEPTTILEQLPVEISRDQREANICRERKIFVKAALQLIESGESDIQSRIIAYLNDANSGIPDPSFEIIRSGYLKKGTTGGVMTSMGLGSKSGPGGSLVWRS